MKKNNVGMARITKSYSVISKLRLLTKWPYKKKNFFKDSPSIKKTPMPLYQSRILDNAKIFYPKYNVSYIINDSFGKTQRNHYSPIFSTLSIHFNDARIDRKRHKIIKKANALKIGKSNYKKLALKYITKFEEDLYGNS